MKKLIVLIMILSLVMLCGCKDAANGQDNSTVPNTTEPTGNSAGNETTAPGGDPTNPIDWETPIDVDDSFLEEQPEETDPTEPDSTKPDPTKPGATEPNVTEPDPTESGATEPAPTETEPTEPEPTKSKPIELPMISG